MPIHRDDLGGLKPLEDVWRVGDDDLLVPLAAEEVSHRPLARGVEMDFRLVDCKHIGCTFSEVKKSHRHELTCPIRLLQQRNLLTVSIEEDRHILKHITRRISHAPHRKIVLANASRHGATEVHGNTPKELSHRLIFGQFFVELIQQILQALFV